MLRPALMTMKAKAALTLRLHSFDRKVFVDRFLCRSIIYQVLRAMNWGAFINLIGMGSTLLGLQATVGLLVAKTLTNATANPYLSGGVNSYNPVLALDVFLVQVTSLSQSPPPPKNPLS